jgi:GH15 family glucan-1,4-alpha-glucosidase
MAWVAVDRAIRAVERFGLKGPAETWKKLRQTIHDEVCREGFDRERNAFVQYFGSKALDASALLIPLVGFLPADDPRILSTRDAICAELVDGGFVRRYSTADTDDGLPHGEATFIACSFWLADNFAITGDFDKARNIFERILDIRNDVGLLAEEYDPINKRQLGNFPQAFSHVGLINTARNLTRGKGPAEKRANPQST